jgi:glycosyltransferase involved in cell wall biosynthesis
MERAEYIPNGFDTGRFAATPRERERWRALWNVSSDATVFGLFARYHPAKGHDYFLRAARMVRAARPATRFVLAGSGVDEGNDALVTEIQDAGLRGHVNLLGEKHDVANLLPALDVYVSPSVRIEAFSNSVGEAMSCGLPCVVTDVGDSPAIVEHAGRVVPPCDPNALAAAMIEMVDLCASGRASLGARARQRIVAHFDIEGVAGRYAALYEELIGARRYGT